MSVATLRAELETSLSALISNESHSDFPFDDPVREPIANNFTLIQTKIVGIQPDRSVDANEARDWVAISIEFHHRIDYQSSATAQTTYLDGELATIYADVATPEYWRALATVHEIDGDSIQTTPPDSVAIEGHVISFGVAVIALLQ